MLRKSLSILITIALVFGSSACSSASSSTDNLEKEIAQSSAETEVSVVSAPASVPDEEPPLTLGDEQFDIYIPLLAGKRVALFSNHTGIVGDKDQHILDALIEHDVNVTAIFSPEHGFRGTEDAGKAINDSIDEKTGVPILSLYNGDSYYPSRENMDTLTLWS